MIKICTICAEEFEITDDDQKFYDKISPVIVGKKYQIPSPTLCPKCRQQRRFAFRNERNLYHRKCDLTGKQIISNYGPHTEMKIYDPEAWWSDKWNPKIYGREFDFNKSFFEQFFELRKDTPQLALSVWNSSNSDFCNYVGHVKDSYLIFGSIYAENCYYGSPYYSTACIDNLVIRECEYCYECIDCRKLYECLYCQDCHGSNNLIYCFDLQSCSDCIGCAGLRNKKFCIFNEQFSKEEYEKKKKELNLCNPQVHPIIKEKLNELKLKIPHKYMQSNLTENVSGNYIFESKNVFESFYTDKSQDCKFCTQIVDLKDCYDNNYTEENELCYEYIGAYQNHHLLYSVFSNRNSDLIYCTDCFYSKNLFGCVGIRNAEYCILNKQYTKEEYEELVPRIIEQMSKTTPPADGHLPLIRGGQELPLLNKEGSGEVEWGQFFPISLSPFAYNETVAQEYFPLTKEECLKKGYKWKDEDESSQYQGPIYQISDDIKNVKDNICDAILKCEITGRLYKIIPQELKFYREMNLPIPRRCPDQRHKDRMTLRNPRKLFDRKCMKCNADIKTTYSPERPEIVYCEDCYLDAVY